MTDCIFFFFLNGDIPCKKVYENDDVLAFYDIAPKAPTHVIVVPKVHVANFLEAADKPEVLNALALAVKAITEELGVAESGFRLVTNIGKNGGQSVLHLHYHILAGREFGENFG